jgi:hypothetical protein
MADFDLADDGMPVMDMEARVRTELRPGERLVWVGQPNPARWMFKTLPILFIAIPWTACTLFMLAATSGLLDAFGIGGKWRGVMHGVAVRIIFSLFFALPLALIGLGMTSAPLWAWRMAFRTFYAITDQRVLIWEANPLVGKTLRTIPPEDLHRLSRREFADGSGDLVFDNVTHDSDGRQSSYENGFIGIARVREVEDMIHKMFPPD